MKWRLEHRKARYGVAISVLMATCVLFGACNSNDDESVPAASLTEPAIYTGMLITAEDYYRQRNFAAALEILERLIAEGRHVADAHFLMGRVYSDMMLTDRAETAYLRTIEEDEDYHAAYFNLANHYFRLGRYTSAMERYTEAYQLNPSPQALVNIGRCREHLGQLEQALAIYERAIAEYPEFARAYMLAGRVHSESGNQLEEAESLVGRALGLEPDNADFSYLMGTVLLRRNEAEKAIPYLERVIEAVPWHHGAFYNLGQAYTRTGDDDLAEQMFAQADSTQVLLSHAEQLERDLQVNPDAFENWISYGNVLRDSGRYDDAIQAYIGALHLRPGDLHLLNNLANLHLLQGDTLRAIQGYEAILKQDESLSDVWINLGIVHASFGDDEKARDAWQNALEQGGDARLIQAYIAELDAAADTRD